jgi:hypothetical protein
MERTMAKLTKILNTLVLRESLYCLWIRAHEGEDAPLIPVWIDPSMTTFDTRAKAVEPEAAATPSQIETALAGESNS